MINLLPTEYKHQLRAARANTFLVRYIFVLLLAAAFVVVVIAGAYWLLTQTKTSAESLIEVNSDKAAVYQATEQEITNLSSNLVSSKQILDRQNSYAKTLRAIGATMPTGAIVERIELKDSSFNAGSLTLKIFARNNQIATSVREAFANSAQFTGVNIDSISETGGVDGYPSSATLTLSLNRSIGR